MSEVNRYEVAELRIQRDWGVGTLVVNPKGQLVSWNDYKRLLDENESLKKELTNLRKSAENSHT